MFKKKEHRPTVLQYCCRLLSHTLRQFPCWMLDGGRTLSFQKYLMFSFSASSLSSRYLIHNPIKSLFINIKVESGPIIVIYTSLYSTDLIHDIKQSALTISDLRSHFTMRSLSRWSLSIIVGLVFNFFTGYFLCI